ncbi:MAG: hypothetical protein NC548_50940, partial [Lachnospiraceae bacterium]|nr:hypothetical protein [Lachnospiraceae bacterium]
MYKVKWIKYFTDDNKDTEKRANDTIYKLSKKLMRSAALHGGNEVLLLSSLNSYKEKVYIVTENRGEAVNFSKEMKDMLTSPEHANTNYITI